VRQSAVHVMRLLTRNPGHTAEVTGAGHTRILLQDASQRHRSADGFRALAVLMPAFRSLTLLGLRTRLSSAHAPPTAFIDSRATSSHEEVTERLADPDRPFTARPSLSTSWSDLAAMCPRCACRHKSERVAGFDPQSARMASAQVRLDQATYSRVDGAIGRY
jgi:hypothetical protein